MRYDEKKIDYDPYKRFSISSWQSLKLNVSGNSIKYLSYDSPNRACFKLFACMPEKYDTSDNLL